MRLGSGGWLIAAAAMGIVILLAGARAAWITYALVLLCSGWRVLGAKRLIGVFAFGSGATRLILTALAHHSVRSHRESAHSGVP